VRGPFSVDGTRVLQADRAAFIPYGITVPGLANGDYWRYRATDDQKITATASDWCANTVRLQVAQSNLVGAYGHTYVQAYMNAIKGEVSLAERLGLAVVVNDQTETVGHEPEPNDATVAFWAHLARAYGHDPQVVFDLFNEPRLLARGPDQVWAIWQHGGTFAGRYYRGMQQLVEEVRGERAKNLLWIEGPYWARTLARVRAYPIHGTGIVYAFHHPPPPQTPASWGKDFGYLVFAKHAPVVDGEWTNYTPLRGQYIPPAKDTSAWATFECWRDARTAVPAYLAYLQKLGIGMTIWQLSYGTMVGSLSPSGLGDPTVIGANWNCGVAGLDEGVGDLVMNWYLHQNHAL
jgi:hypothetical protein